MRLSASPHSFLLCPDLNVAAAMLALFSLFLMVMGAICISMSISREVLFFLKPASVCFILSGENIAISWRHFDDAPSSCSSVSPGFLVLLSLLVFHQSVLLLLSSDHTVPLHHQLSWSVSCIGCAGAVLIIGGVLFLLLALPFSPWMKCLTHKDSPS